MKILFVCHGNICRSPMAEFVFKRIAKENGVEEKFEVSSKATSAEELGNPVYPPARSVLMRHGIDCTGKIAVQLTRLDYNKYDLLVGMDGANIRNMHRLFDGDPDSKITKLMDYTGRSTDVEDPWYSGNFEAVFRDIYEGCEALFSALSKDGK